MHCTYDLFSLINKPIDYLYDLLRKIRCNDIGMFNVIPTQQLLMPTDWLASDYTRCFKNY